METSRRHKELCSAALLDVKLNPICLRMFHMLDDPRVKLCRHGFFFFFFFFFFTHLYLEWSGTIMLKWADLWNEMGVMEEVISD